MAMSYQEARRIRETSLKDLILRNVDRGQGAFGAVGSALAERLNPSKRFAAKVTGIKERFDPINIAKKLTGNVGAALVGRMMGRSQEDIRYFSGRGRLGSYRGITQDNDLDNLLPAVYTKVNEGQKQKMKKGDSVADVLSKLYNLMKRNYRNEENRRELDINFKFKEQKKKDKRHKELIKAITGLKYNQAVGTAKREEGENIFEHVAQKIKDVVEKVGKMITAAIAGALLLVKDLIATAIGVAMAGIKGLLDFVGELKKLFPKGIALLADIIKWFGRARGLGPALLGIASLAALAYTIYELSTALQDKATDLGGTEVGKMEALQQQQEAVGGLDESAIFAMTSQAGVQESPIDIKKRIIREFQTDIQEYLAPEGYFKIKEDGDGRFYFKNSADKAPPKELLDEAKIYAQSQQNERIKNGEKKKIQDIAPGTSMLVEPSDARGGQGSSLASENDSRRTDLKKTPDIKTTAGGAAMVSPHIKKASTALPDTGAGSGQGMARMIDYAAQQEPTGASFGVRPHGVPKAQMQQSAAQMQQSAATPIPPQANPISQRALNSMNEHNELIYKDMMPKLVNIDNSKTIMSPGGASNKVIFDTSVNVRSEDSTLNKVSNKNARAW